MRTGDGSIDSQLPRAMNRLVAFALLVGRTAAASA